MILQALAKRVDQLEDQRNQNLAAYIVNGVAKILGLDSP